MKPTLIFLLGIWLATAIHADIIFLKNGGKLEGKVTEKGNAVEIELPTGILTIPRSQIKNIERAVSKIDMYRQYKTLLTPADVEGHYQLAIWCRENKLSDYYEEELQMVIAENPDHEQARQGLGYERYENRWVTRDEAMALRGYVKFRDNWVKPEERDAVLIDEITQNLEQEKRLRQLAEKRLAQAEQRLYLIEMELARLNGTVAQLSEEVKRRQYVIIKRRYTPRYPTEIEDGEIQVTPHK